MDDVEFDSLLQDATGALTDRWGVPPDAAMQAMMVVARALGLSVTDLAALVSASSCLHRDMQRPVSSAGARPRRSLALVHPGPPAR